MPVAQAQPPRQTATQLVPRGFVRRRWTGCSGTLLVWHRACIAPRVATYNQRSASALDAVPTTELMRQVLDETKELVRIETKLAREEIYADLRQLKSAAIFGGVALVLALLTLVALLIALVLAIGGAASALLIAIVMLLGASLCAALAYQRLPKPPLARTRERLRSDVTQLKEHIQ